MVYALGRLNDRNDFGFERCGYVNMLLERDLYIIRTILSEYHGCLVTYLIQRVKIPPEPNPQPFIGIIRLVWVLLTFMRPNL